LLIITNSSVENVPKSNEPAILVFPPPPKFWPTQRTSGSIYWEPKRTGGYKGRYLSHQFFKGIFCRYDTTEYSRSLVSFSIAGMNCDNRTDDLRGGLSLVVITAQDGAKPKLGTVRPRPKKGGQIWRFLRGPHLWPPNNSGFFFFGPCLASAHFAAFARESHLLFVVVREKGRTLS